jgi:DUF4097 and DUF4098 domain-containing protein YvlB
MNTDAIRTIVSVALLLTAASTASAIEVDRTIDLASGGRVDIEVPEGRLVIRGWDREQVRLTGTLGGDPDQVEIDADGSSVQIEAAPGDGFSGKTALELWVPRLSELGIEAIACDVTLDGVRADEVELEIVHGEVRVDGTIEEIDVEAVSGPVDLDGRLGRVRVESAAGHVNVAGVTRTVSVDSVSGPLDVTASEPLEVVDLSTASGGIRYTGGLRANGVLRAESLNGNVELRLDPGTRADVDVETYNGGIVVDWAGVELDRYASGVDRSASFTLGRGGGARIEVETFNGRCIIRQN